jgi:hypothetical protein
MEKCTVSTAVVNKFCGYDRFNITLNDCSTFLCSGISESVPGFLEFERLFASSKISDTVVKYEMRGETKCIVYTKANFYVIEATHKRAGKSADTNGKVFHNIYDLMDKKYLTHYYLNYLNKMTSCVVLIVDPDKLDGLSYRQKVGIMSILNGTFNVQGEFWQRYRTIYYRIEYKDFANTKIYAGVYFPENEIMVNERKIYHGEKEYYMDKDEALICRNLLSVVVPECFKNEVEK